MAAPEPEVVSPAAVPGKAWGPDLGVLGGPVYSLPPFPPTIYTLALSRADLPLSSLLGVPPPRPWLGQSDPTASRPWITVVHPHSAFISAAFCSPLDYTFNSDQGLHFLRVASVPCLRNSAPLLPPQPVPGPRFLTIRRH